MADFFLSHIEDLAWQARERDRLSHTGFLSPAQQENAKKKLAGIGVSHHFLGGYAEAERNILLLMPARNDFAFDLNAAASDLIAALAILPKFAAADLCHRDYLGSLLSLGVRRDQIGDLLVNTEQTTVLCLQSIASYLCQHLCRVASVSVSVSLIPLSQIRSLPKQVKSIRVTAASLRLDKIASEGFGLSRSQIVQSIKKGAVQVDWQTQLRPDLKLTVGQIISLQGHGRIRFAETLGQSRKNREIIILERYL